MANPKPFPSPATSPTLPAGITPEMWATFSAEQRAAIAKVAEQARMMAEPKVTLKVSNKGAVSLYGFGRWPVTLYSSQMSKLLDMADEIRAFIRANEGALRQKGEDDAAYTKRTGRVVKADERDAA